GPAPLRRLCPIGSAPANVDAQCLEVAGRHLHHRHAVLTPAGAPRDFGDERGASLFTVDRQRLTEADGLDTPQGLDTPADLFIERAHAVVGLIADGRERDTQRENTARLESRLHIPEIP